MRIAAFVKQGADVRSVRINASTGEPSIAQKPVTSSGDLHVTADAVGFREASSGELTVVSFGPAAVRDSIVSSLATGADAGIQVSFDGGNADTLFVATALADAVREQQFDVLIAGKISDDYGTGQVAMQIAALLDIPHLSNVISFVPGDDGKINVTYDLDGFPDEIQVPTPVMLVLGTREDEPTRHSSLRGMMQAKKKPIDEIRAQGEPAGTIQWSAPMAARRSGDRTVLRNEPVEEMAKKLADWLREHRLVG